MTLENFTIKAQEAVQQAVQQARRNGQQVIEPVHLLKGVLEKGKDVTTFIFQKLGVNGVQEGATPMLQGYQPRKQKHCQHRHPHVLENAGQV